MAHVAEEALALWPHQTRGIAGTLDALDRGVRRLLLTSPTGMGKSRMVNEIIVTLAERGWSVVVYTNRVLLREQLQSVMDGHGIVYGVRAAGFSDGDHVLQVQISSLPTELSRTVKRKTWNIHGGESPTLAVVDEAHLNAGPGTRQILALHHDAGHYVLGITATPIDLGDVYDELLIAGSVSEGRECGALVAAHHYGPDEPDMRALKRDPADLDELTEPQARKLSPPSPTLFGRVWTWFERLNPDRRPAILFAPGVPESVWFAEQFQAKGVNAAHIDGADVWVRGEWHRTSPDVRRQVLDGSRCGDIGVVCNRFVLREGIDCPWLEHGIFATVFGSTQTYLQSGGRLLRACDGKDKAVIQDHGGNWWRYGSLNEDRAWRLEETSGSVYDLRAQRLRQKKDAEPYRCPQCAMIMVMGRCRGCGFEPPPGKRSRPVVTAEGHLIELGGHIFRPRRTYRAPDGPQLWERMYFRSCTDRGRRTFRAAAALFAYENDWGWPDRSWPFMPRDEFDWYRDVPDVPRERLT